MRIWTRLAFIIGLPCMAMPVYAADDSFNAGAGIGFSYSGLGGYAAYTQGEQTVAVSAGLTSIGNNNTTVGAGVSWLYSGWFENANGSRQAVGLYVGAVRSENYRRDGSRFGRRTTWGGGPVFQFYQNGIQQSGFVGGAAMLLENGHNSRSVLLSLSIGYQF